MGQLVTGIKSFTDKTLLGGYGPLVKQTKKSTLKTVYPDKCQHYNLKIFIQLFH